MYFLKGQIKICVGLITLSLFTFFLSQNTFAQTKTYTGSGNWSTGANWSPSGVPLSSDLVIIPSGSNVTVDDDYNCDSVYFATGATASSIIISGSKKLTVTNGISFSNPTANVTQLLNVDAGTLECGSLTMPNLTTGRVNKVSASTGIVKVNGNLSCSGSTSENIIEFTDAGKFMLGGTWSPSSGTFTNSTSSFEYFSASTQTIAAKTYNKLILTGAIKNPGGTITCNDSIIINAGATLNNSGTASLVFNSIFYIAGTYIEGSTSGSVTLIGLIHIASSGVFQVNVAEIFSIRGGIKNDGTFISGAGTYTFATNDQTLSGSNLTTFSGPVTVTTITLTVSDSIRINGNLTGTGTFVNQKYLLLAGATNTITNLDLSAAGNMVVYGRTGNQTIKGADYKNLRIIASGTNTANGNVTVANSLYIDTLVTFALSTNTLAFSPGCLVTGSGILTTTNLSATPIPEGITWPYTTVTYSGAAGQTIVSGTYNNLSSSNAARILSSTSPIIINGVFTAGTGAFTSTGSTVILNNPSTQTIPALLNGYNKLILNGATKNPSGTVVCNDSIIVNPGCTLNNSGSASLTFNGVFYIAGTYIEGSTSGNVTLSGLVHIAPTGTFQANVGESFIIRAGIKNEGTFVSGTGVYTFSTNNQELSGSTLFTFSGGVTVTGITLTTTNSVRINGNFTGTGTYVNKSTLTLMGVTNNVSTLDLTTAGNTVEYGANGTQTVNAAAYKNLRVSGTGTNTAGGAISVENSLFIDATTTFALSTHQLTFSVGCLATGTGNLTTANTSATPIPAGIIWPYTTITYNSGSAQTIVGGTYKNLTSSSIARTLSSTDTIFISGVFTPGSGAYTSAGSTVVFNSAGAQNVPAISGGYNNLSLANGSTKTATGAITVNNNLNLLNTTTFNLAAYALSSAALSVSGVGEITTTNTSASPLPSAVAWPVKVTYAGGTQILVAGTYSDLSLQGSSTKTANGNVTVNGPLAINTGVTMVMGTNLLNGTLTSLPSTGAITTANTSAAPIPVNRTWAIPITYNSSSSQTIVHGSYTNLTSTNFARVLSTLGTINISGVFTPGTGVYTTTGSTIEFNGSGAQSIPVINPGYNHLTSSGTGARTLASGTINVSGNYNAGSNSYTVTGNTFVLNGTNQNFNGTFNSLTLSTSGTKTATANISVATTLIVNASITLELGTSAVLGGALTTVTNNGTIRTAVPTSTSSLPLPASKTWAGTVEYYSSAAQTAVAGTYTNLIFNGNSTKSMGGNIISNTSLTLTNGKLNINGNTLTLGGTLVNTVSGGLIGSTTSNLIVNNAVARTLSFDQTIPGNTNVLNNFTNNSGAQTTTLGNTLNIITAVTPTTGTIASGGNLVLVSNASGTARIAQGTGSYISGNVKAQRFVPSSARRWRFMASPITNATVNDWRGEIYITGPGTGNTVGTTNSNGFDATANNSPTMYWYNEVLTTGDLNTGWTSPTNATNALTAGLGYRVFVRGDRSDLNRISDANATQNAVTMDVVGPVNTGDITMPVTFTSSGTIANDGWNLLGNPYPSAFDWNAFNDAGRSGNNGTYYTKIEPTIYVLDATDNSYKFYNALSNSGSITGGIIASGQAFWVKATATSPTMTFKELYKSASTPTQLFKTTEGGAFKLRVIKDSANADEVFVKYMNGSTTGFDDYDAIKLSSQISISAYGDDAKYLALTTRPLTTINDTIKLYLNVATSGSYNMTFTNSEEIAILDQVWLVDNYTNAVIDLKTTPNYIINVNTTIASSFGGNRFYIVVANNNPVPVKLLTFAGNKIGENQVALNWSTASEKNSESFEIEHAIDGKNFSSIGKVKANGNSSVKLNYAFNHNQASTLNYYRLKLINNDKTFEYSNTIMVDFNNTNTQPTDVVKIYPIPATTNLTVELNNQLNITQILVYNIEGLLMHAENTNSTKVDLNLNEFASGVYVLQIKDELGNVLKRKLIKQ